MIYDNRFLVFFSEAYLVLYWYETLTVMQKRGFDYIKMLY